MISGALTLPASTASQRSSLVTDATVGASLRYAPNDKIIITPQLGVYARDYRYETADMAGRLANSPYGVSYGLAGSYVFFSWLAGTVAYSQTQRYDFFSDWRTIQSVSGKLTANVSSTFSAYVGYRWRDRTITNDALFDDRKSLIFTGVSYAF